MYLESITLIDAGDEIAFIDELPFEYEGVHEITDEMAMHIDWVVVHKAQVTGDLLVLDVTHIHTKFRTQYRVADFVKVLVYEE